jgi:hypothetical protein
MVCRDSGRSQPEIPKALRSKNYKMTRACQIAISWRFVTAGTSSYPSCHRTANLQ